MPPSSPLIEKPPTSTTLIAGKYALVRIIGRGGMGSVWEARHVTLNTRVAVKFIETDSTSSAEARVRFDNEAKAAATIQSKHAIQIFDHGVTDDGHPYIVMEMLEGETLDHRIETRGRLSVQETAKILLQVCRGLNRAHERGIVHRDLKPENIFLVRGEDDDDEIAKVLDFGIAKIRAGDDAGGLGLSSGTKTGAVLGTPYFMSPEQARGLKEVDHRTDIWSLGVIAYKCVVGELPFVGQAVGDLLVKICTSPIPVPSHFAPDIPAAFDTWFARALDRDQDQRFSSVTELANGLAYAAGMSSRGSRVTPAGPGHTQPLGHATGSAPAQAQSTPPPGYESSGSSGRMTPEHDTERHAVSAHLSDNPGATSAPFTTSMHTPGIPQRRPALGIAIGIVTFVAAGLGVFAMVAQHKAQQDEAVAAKQRSEHLGAATASAIADGLTGARAVAVADMLDAAPPKTLALTTPSSDPTDGGTSSLPLPPVAPPPPKNSPVHPGGGAAAPRPPSHPTADPATHPSPANHGKPISGDPGY